MTHVITSLCLREDACAEVCPVEAIKDGDPIHEWPTYYIDPSSCIDCGACVPECPYHAIYPEDEVPAAYQAAGNELLNQKGLTGHYEGTNHDGQPVVLETVRALAPGEIVDLRSSIKMNANFYR